VAISHPLPPSVVAEPVTDPVNLIVRVELNLVAVAAFPEHTEEE
jgi:hypothetical protein